MTQVIIYDCEKEQIQQHTNCIYMYVNKVNNKKYVGQTINFKDRHRRHIKDKKYPIDKAISKYGINSFNVYILKEDIELIEERNKLEELYIQKYKTLINEGKGYNVKRGGNNHEMNELTKKKLSESRIGKFKGEENPFYGKVHNEETKQVIREARKRNACIYQAEEYRQKIGQAVKGEKNGMYGKAHTKETKNKISSSKKGQGTKQICQYNINGHFIKVWDSIQEASYYMGLSTSNISASLKQEVYKCGGYYWRYYTNETSLKNITPPRTKPRIGQYSKQGDLIKVWDSLKQIGENTDYNKTSINNNLMGRNKSAGGFVWRYIDENNDFNKIEEVTYRPRVLQYDKEGNLIKEWESLTEVCKHTGYKVASLNNCITGKSKTSHGFVWKYAN